MAAGEVLLGSRPSSVRARGAPAEQIGRGVVEAPPERVFRALVDFAHYQEFMPFVRRSEVEPAGAPSSAAGAPGMAGTPGRSGGAAATAGPPGASPGAPASAGVPAQPPPAGSVVSFQALDFPRPIGPRHYKIHASWGVEEQSGRRVWRIRWTYIPGSGNVAGHYGSWALAELAGGKTLAVCHLYTDAGGGIPGWAMDLGTAQTLPYIFSGLRQQIHRSRYDVR